MRPYGVSHSGSTRQAGPHNTQGDDDMNSQLLYQAAHAHNDDLRRAAKATRSVDGLPRRSRFARFGHLFASARLAVRRPHLRPVAGELDVDATSGA